MNQLGGHKMSQYRSCISHTEHDLTLKAAGDCPINHCWVAPLSEGRDRLWMRLNRSEQEGEGDVFGLTLSFSWARDGIEMEIHGKHFMQSHEHPLKMVFNSYTNRTQIVAPKFEFPYKLLECDIYDIIVDTSFLGDFVILQGSCVNDSKKQVVIVNLSALMMFEVVDMFSLSGGVYYMQNCIGSTLPENGNLLPLHANSVFVDEVNVIDLVQKFKTESHKLALQMLGSVSDTILERGSASGLNVQQNVRSILNRFFC
jgi:hypothetical protein